MPMTGAARARRAQERATTEATSYTMSSPVGGLNSRDALADMPETDAVVLDNWFPQPTWVEVRGGKTTIAKLTPGSVTGQCETLMAYNSLSGTNQLFAAVSFATGSPSAGIYRADNVNGGQVGSVVQAITNAVMDYQQFGTGAAEVLVAVNGTDSPAIYDGTTWYTITATSSPYAWTSGPSPLTSLSQVARYKSRLWFVQKGTFNVYYLPQNVFAGAMTLLALGPNFNLGGYLQMMVTVSVDNSAGLNDYIAFISNQGEVVVFQGYDPSSVSTWSEAAHFRIGRPLGTGRRGWQKLGADAVVACIDGVVPLSKALVTDRSQENIAISDKIRSTFNSDVQTYGGNFGWQVLLYPNGLKLIVNVPTSAAGTNSYAYVQNIINGSWCTFGKLNSPWNATCFELMGDALYYGGPGIVAQADIPLGTDDGAAILATAQPAFSYMGVQEQFKQWTMCQPIFQTFGNVSATISLGVDFNTNAPASNVPISSSNSSPWSTSYWNTPSYWGGASMISKPWLGLAAEGYCASLQMKISANAVRANWQSTKYIFKSGTLFYG